MRGATAVASAWSASIMLVWAIVAFALGQPLWAQQRSGALLAFGALRGGDLAPATAWRLVASQWLHVEPAHMLLNCALVAGLGTILGHRTMPATMVLTGIAGGAVGQAASALANTGDIASGASQAYLALAGAILVLLAPRRAGWWAAVVACGAAAALDLRAVGMIKPGHLTAFIAGVVAAVVIARFPGRAPPATPPA